MHTTTQRRTRIGTKRNATMPLRRAAVRRLGIVLLLVLATAGCNKDAEEPHARPAFTTLGAALDALPPVLLEGKVIAAQAAASQWGGDRVLLELRDKTLSALDEPLPAGMAPGTDVRVRGRLRPTVHYRTQIAAKKGETADKPLAQDKADVDGADVDGAGADGAGPRRADLSLTSLERCADGSCVGEPVVDRLGLTQCPLDQPLTLRGTLVEGQSMAGQARTLLRLDDGLLEVRVVAEGTEELRGWIGRAAELTGRLRLSDEPEHYVQIDGREHFRVGALFLSQPSFRAAR
jgi:hypothetical protein